MAHVLIMPRQGNTVESCIIVGWKVAEGQVVSAGQPVCEVETDKASFEVPAGSDGKLLKILHPEGADVPVLQPIAIIGAEGEDWAALVPGAASAGATTPAAEASATMEAKAVPEAAVPGLGAASEAPVAAVTAAAASTAIPEAVSPRARRVAKESGLSLAGLEGSGPGGRVIERDVRAVLAAGPALTKAASALAAAIPPSGLPGTGSGLGGRLTAADLAAPTGGAASTGSAASSGGAAPTGSATSETPKAAPTGGTAPVVATPSSPVTDEAFPGPYSDSPVKGVRRIIAERMRASLAQAAQLTLNSSAPAARMLELRARLKGGAGGPVLAGATIGDLVLAATARTLVQFPELNAHFRGDSIRTFRHVHLGLAVDTPRGLMVPVIRNAESLSLAALSAETKRLAAACLNGTILPDELSGSTFTVTNLGGFGIESFTPVLNTPEVGILGVCAITDRPSGAGSEKRIGLSLTIDHQAVDGAPGARFLQALSAALADIDLFLLK